MVDVLLRAQRNEITEHILYKELAEKVGGENREILRRIAEEELSHYKVFRELTGRDVEPDRLRILFFKAIATILGVTFAIKLMERSEEDVQREYEKLVGTYPILSRVLEEERVHERELEAMVQDEISRHLGSIILGLNDALVELTGAIVGLSAALVDSRSVLVSSLVVGLSAALSMAASEYLSKRAEGEAAPLRAALFTGLAYIGVVVLLVLPFAFLPVWSAVPVSLLISVLIASAAGTYVAVVHDRDVKSEVLTMVTLSLGVAAVSFAFSSVVKELV